MTTLTTYTLQVLSPDEIEETHLLPEAGEEIAGVPVFGRILYRFSNSDKRVLANLPAMVESIEEDFNDLLPEGYTARIREWQEEAVTE